MDESKVRAIITYSYMKAELEALVKQNRLSPEQVEEVSLDLKSKLGIPANMCWI